MGKLLDDESQLDSLEQSDIVHFAPAYELPALPTPSEASAWSRISVEFDQNGQLLVLPSGKRPFTNRRFEIKLRHSILAIPFQGLERAASQA